MGQSLVKNYVHIVFSTKHRHHLIMPQHEEELYAYLGGTCNAMNCQSIKVGGISNHVHILCFLSKNVALANLLEKIKSHSSKWMKTKGKENRNFYWQDGYGAFSVNPADIDVVARYIENQNCIMQKRTSRMNTGRSCELIRSNMMSDTLGIKA